MPETEKSCPELSTAASSDCDTYAKFIAFTRSVVVDKGLLLRSLMREGGSTRRR
jgi:hypothetical protein